MSGISDLGQRVADLYKEIVTTTVRFESLHRETTTTITEAKTAIQRFEERMQQMHLDHVRERAELSSQINALDARLNALSEGALHAVARDAARQAMHTILKDGEGTQIALRSVPDGESGSAGRLLPLGQ
jgi:serine phosphatase RsbU (regulator of sigma subunit)